MLSQENKRKESKSDDSDSDEDHRMMDINNLGGGASNNQDDDDRDDDEEEDGYEDDFKGQGQERDQDIDEDQYDDDEEEEQKNQAAVRGLKRQTDQDNLEESNKLQQLSDDEDEQYNQEGDFEESPRPKGPSNGVGREQDDDPEPKLDADEDERIEIAEKVLITIVKTMLDNGIQSIRELVKDHLYESMIQGNIFELLLPENLLECLNAIGLSLTTAEQICLLEVLSKQEFENVIVMEELEAIMQNVQDVVENPDEVTDSQQSPDPYQAARNNLDDSSPDVRDAQSKKKPKTINLDNFDQDSIFCMLGLLMCLMQEDTTADQFFEKIIFSQEVKKGDKKKKLKIMDSKKFFDILRMAEIWKFEHEHENLKENLKLDSRYPNYMLLRKVKETLEAL